MKEIDGRLYRATGEKHDCTNGLRGEDVLFDSLQSDGRGCSGVKNKTTLESTCKLCDQYVINVERKNWEEIDRPIGKKQR